MDVDAWIERALYRVEALETERAHCAGASGDPQAALRTIEIDAEVEALVEALEAAADDAEAEAAGRFEPGTPAGYTTIAEPFVRSDDTAPMHVARGLASSADDELIDLPRRRLLWPAAVASVAVLVVGLGVAVASSGRAASASPSATATSLAAAVPTRVATAEVPPDTQEPEVARGADVDATPPTAIPEPAAPAPAVSAERKKTSSSKRASRRGKKKVRRAEKKPSKDRSVAFGRSRDPLSGVK